MVGAAVVYQGDTTMDKVEGGLVWGGGGGGGE